MNLTKSEMKKIDIEGIVDIQVTDLVASKDLERC